MKLLFITFLTLATTILADNAKLSWTRSSTPQVNAYRLYAWADGNTTKPLFVLNLPNITNATANNLVIGKYIFTVTPCITNLDGSVIEGKHSNPVTVSVAPSPVILREDN